MEFGIGNLHKLLGRIQFLLVLYGFETWSLTLRREHGLKVFENGVQRRIFEPKRDDTRQGSRKIHNEKLHNCTLRQI
jgi:hypothetical protein